MFSSSMLPLELPFMDLKPLLLALLIVKVYTLFHIYAYICNESIANIYHVLS